MAYSLIPQGIRALIAALGPAGAAQVASEQIKQQPELANSIDQAFRRVLMGPSEELISKFQETPSGIVFGPDVQAQEETREKQKKFLQPSQPGGIDMKELLMPSDQQTTPNPLEEALVLKPEQIDPIVETFPSEQQGLIKVFNQKKSKDELFDAEDFEVFEEGKKYYDERYPNLTRDKLPKIVDADKYFGASATATPVAENTGYLVHLDPKDYIKMTRKFNPEEENSQNRIQAIEYLIDNNLEVAQYPTLYVSKEGENFEVNGHEGRHRAQAFLNKGFDKIPVMIRGYSRNKDNEENKHFTVRPDEDAPSYVKEKMGFTPKKIYSEDGAPGGVLEIDKSQYLDPATRQSLFVKKDKSISKDKVQKFFDKQETLFDDDYEKGIKSYSEDTPLTDKAIIGMEDIVQTRPNQYQPVHRYWEDMWAGGVGDVGERLAGEVMRSGGMLETSEGLKAPSYYEEYKGKLQDLAVKELGKEFVGYRLMSRAEMEDMLKGGKSIGDVKSYSLDKDKALSFKNFANEAFTDRETGKPRTDLVLAEAPLNYEGLVMRGKADEKEVVYDNQFTSMNEVNFYDLDGKLIKGAEKGMLLQKEKLPNK